MILGPSGGGMKTLQSPRQKKTEGIYDMQGRKVNGKPTPGLFDDFVARKWPRDVVRAKGICYFDDERDMSIRCMTVWTT